MPDASRSTGQDKVRAQIEEIGSRAERATPGPWEVYVGAGLMVLGRDGDGSFAEVANVGSGSDTSRDPDGEFIAESRTDIPRLVAALTAVLDLAAKHRHGALRWEHPLPVPEWISLVESAIATELRGIS